MRKKLFNIIISVMLAICSVFIFSGCYLNNMKRQGLEKWDPNTSIFSLGHYQFPSEDYLETSEYIEGDYFFNYRDKSFLGKDTRETSFVYLVYDEETYETEKQYIFDNMPLSTCSFSYNGYVFYENLSYPVVYRIYIKEYSIPFNPSDYPEMEGYMTEQGTTTFFPNKTTFFGYNDEKRILLFFFMYANDAEEELAKSLMEEGWDVFLKEFFPYYDFDS